MKFLISIILIGFINFFLAQQELVPISNGLDNNYAKPIYQTNANFHSVIQPYNTYKINELNIELDDTLTNTKLDLIKKEFRTGGKKMFISQIGRAHV